MGTLALVKQPVSEKKNSEFKPAIFHLKNTALSAGLRIH